MSLWTSEYNSATRRSYGDVNIYACCCRRGESIFKGIRFTRVSLIREKCKFQREDLIIRRTYKPIYTVVNVLIERKYNFLYLDSSTI